MLLKTKFFMFIIISVVFLSFTYAQDMDDLDDEANASDDASNCMPESFSTPWEYYGKTELTPQQVAIKYSYVKDYRKKEDWDKVKKYGWQLVYGDKKRQFKSVYDKLADSYYFTNHPDTALLVCQMGLKDVGYRTRLNHYAAYIQFELGRYSCAEIHLRALLNKKPNELAYWKMLVQSLIKMNKEDAIKAQEKVVELTSNDPAEQSLLGQLYERYGLNAMDAYVKSWQANPSLENIKSATQVTTMAIQQGQDDLGLKVGLEALKLQPDNKIIIRNVAELYNLKMQYNNAIQYYKKYLKYDNSNIDIYCSIADIYREKRDWSSARVYARKAMNKDPNSGKPHIVLANVYQSNASECLNTVHDGKITIDIKLVFQMAYNEYAKASKDPGYQSEANAKKKWLRSSQLTPSKEDKFLHPDVKKPRGKCFSWI